VNKESFPRDIENIFVIFCYVFGKRIRNIFKQQTSQAELLIVS